MSGAEPGGVPPASAGGVSQGLGHIGITLPCSEGCGQEEGGEIEAMAGDSSGPQSLKVWL